jgi:dihydroorotase
MSEKIIIDSPADMHVHLRQDAMSSLVVPHVRQGGMTTGYVMPNTVPPITSVDQCLAYLDSLEAHDSTIELFGTLYLHPSITPEEIIKASKTKSKRGKRRIMGVKSYPRGVTTNSDGGIESYETYYPIFEEMEKQDMILNLHGEVPSSEEQVCTK